MGYSEVHCQICGVSFNVSRFRTAKEPKSAAWWNTGDGVSSHALGHEMTLDKCDSECFFIERRQVDLDEEPASPTSSALSDGSYKPPGDDQDSCSGGDETEAEANPEDDAETHDETQKSKLSPPPNEDEIPDIHIPESARIRRGKLSDKSLSDFESLDTEHIAGPNCRMTGAYNGNNISAAAMRGCNTIQCLIRKTPQWTEEYDDEDFEIKARFFLSGLSDNMPSRDMDIPEFVPMRHGVTKQQADNHIWDRDEAGETAMPFHPACLEIFKRASLLRDGAIDLDGLEHWWFLDSDWGTLDRFPRHEAVKQAREQWWLHQHGDEFLAANPCLVPGLDTIFSRAQSGRKPSGYESTGGLGSGQDAFSVLPLEIRIIILRGLPFTDVISLAQASAAFRNLPQSFHYKSLLEDMPWLYEVWTSLPLSYWATKTGTELVQAKELEDGKEAKLKWQLALLEHDARETDEPDANKGAIRVVSDQIKALREAGRQPKHAMAVPILDREATDWYLLRLQLERQKDRLLGLRNRERIWEDCMEILNRVEALREQGKVPPRSTEL